MGLAKNPERTIHQPRAGRNLRASQVVKRFHLTQLKLSRLFQ
jgi:hypothetical protein